MSSERALSADVLALIIAQVVKPVLFISADFPSGMQRIWSGVGTVSFQPPDYGAPATWVGLGTAMGIEQVAETTDTSVKGIVIHINGLDPTWVSSLLVDEYQGRAVVVYLCFRNPTTGVLYPLNGPLWRGSLDTDEFTAGKTTRELKVMCEHRLADILRARSYNYSYADQLLLYPDVVDTALNKVEGIQDIVIPWGRTNK